VTGGASFPQATSATAPNANAVAVMTRLVKVVSCDFFGKSGELAPVG